jgi:hypothetical protein
MERRGAVLQALELADRAAELPAFFQVADGGALRW